MQGHLISAATGFGSKELRYIADFPVAEIGGPLILELGNVNFGASASSVDDCSSSR
jgi:hypothetical protein